MGRGLLPGSARTRRRLGWLGAALLLAAAVAVLVVALPSKTEPKREQAQRSAPVVDDTPRTVPLRSRDRRAIGRTLDTFLETAVERRDVASSYDLATPELREGMTRAEWAKGDIPVYPYPAGGKSGRGWRINYSYANDVGLDLLVHPRAGSHTRSPIAFSVELKRLGGRWLVNSFNPTAIFSPSDFPGVKSMKDLQPSPVANTVPKRHLSPLLIALPAAILALVLLVPLALFGGSWLRGRRAMRRYRESAGRALPPLPRRDTSASS